MQPSRYARSKREHEALFSKMTAGQTELRPVPLMLDGRSCRARRGTWLRSDARDVEIFSDVGYERSLDSCEYARRRVA